MLDRIFHKIPAHVFYPALALCIGVTLVVIHVWYPTAAQHGLIAYAIGMVVGIGSYVVYTAVTGYPGRQP